MTAMNTPEDVHPLVAEAELFEAKSNRMFTEAMRQLVIFLRFKKAVPCEHCGRRSRWHWTMRCPFRAADLGGFTVVKGDKVLMAGSPICRKHPMHPEIEAAAAAAQADKEGK